jgi:hypothetical protein
MDLSFTIVAGPHHGCHSQVQVAHLYPQALGFLSVASYDSQGYGGGIRTHPAATEHQCKTEISNST